MDFVRAGAADDDVVARAGVDDVVATVERADDIAALKVGDPLAGNRDDRELEAGVVAEDHVGTRAGGDEIAIHAAGDDLVAIAGLDRIDAALAGIDRVGERRQRVVELGIAAVAEHHAVAGTDGDAVALATAEHDVAAIAGIDHVDAVKFGPGAAHRDHLALFIERDAVVAEDDVVAAAGGDLVVERAAHQHMVAGCDGDDVVAAIGDIGRLDRDTPAEAIEDRQAIVAEDDAVAVAGGDLVVAVTAEHDVAAVAGIDHVVIGDRAVRADEGRERAFDAQKNIVLERRLAVVAEDDVVAALRGHSIIAGAGDDDVVAGARLDHVVAVIAGIGALDAGDVAFVVEHDHAVVAEHDVADVVVAAAEHLDGVALRAADKDVAAAGAGDLVGTAEFRIGRLDDRRQTVGEFGAAVVADDQVLPAGALQDIGAEAAEHDVRPLAGVDHVVAADRGVGRLHLHDRAVDHHVERARHQHEVGPVDGRLLRDDAVVADDDVAEVAAEDEVVARHFRFAVGIDAVVVDDDGAVAIIDVEGRVADDPVLAVDAAEDGVGVGAAGDEVGAVAAGQRILAGTAVDDDDAAGARRIDDVVAGIEEAVGGAVRRARYR